MPSLLWSRWSWGLGANEYFLVVVIWKRVLFLTYYHDWRHFIKIDQPGLMQDWRLWIGDFTLKESQFVSKNISRPIIQAVSRRWVSLLTVSDAEGSWLKPGLPRCEACQEPWGQSLQGWLLSERWHISLLPQVCPRWDSPGGGHLLRLCVWGQWQRKRWGLKQTLGRV